MTASVTAQSEPGLASPARFWFAADAAITFLNAVAYVAAAPYLASLLGTDAGTTRSVGFGLLVFAVLVAAVARGGSNGVTFRTPLAYAVVAFNGAWVIGSVVVAASGTLSLSGTGQVWVLFQAGVVGLFTVMQWTSFTKM